MAVLGFLRTVLTIIGCVAADSRTRVLEMGVLVCLFCSVGEDWWSEAMLDEVLELALLGGLLWLGCLDTVELAWLLADFCDTTETGRLCCD